MQWLDEVHQSYYDRLPYNGKGQQFYHTHCHFNIPVQKPIATFIGCRSVVAGLKHVNVLPGLGIRGYLSTATPMSLALC